MNLYFQGNKHNRNIIVKAPKFFKPIFHGTSPFFKTDRTTNQMGWDTVSKVVGDLQLGDQQVTLNHGVYTVYKIFSPSTQFLVLGVLRELVLYRSKYRSQKSMGFPKNPRNATLVGYRKGTSPRAYARKKSAIIWYFWGALAMEAVKLFLLHFPKSKKLNQRVVDSGIQV